MIHDYHNFDKNVFPLYKYFEKCVECLKHHNADVCSCFQHFKGSYEESILTGPELCEQQSVTPQNQWPMNPISCSFGFK